MWFIADKLVQLTIIPQVRVRYEMAGQNDLISNKHKWNNCFPKQIRPHGKFVSFVLPKWKQMEDDT